jgi:nicotinate-nucleotide adenylyltransferase
LHFITGADALASILTWRDPEELLGSANLVGVTRSGHPTPSGQLPNGAARIIQIPALAISSTDCRERVARGAPIRYLVPDPVERFVAESGLYRAGET